MDNNTNNTNNKIDKVMSDNIQLIKNKEITENYWSNTIKTLANKLKCESKDVVDLQSTTLSEKQKLDDEIKKVTYEIIQYKPILKEARKIRTDFYLTKYPLKLQGKDKLYLIEHDLSKYEQKIEILDNHINFLRNVSITFEQIGYAIKNKITLYQLTGLD